jgi:hypothetical protein
VIVLNEPSLRNAKRPEMTNAQLGKLWTALGLALLYYGANSWLVSQGGHEVFGAKLIANDRAPAAVLALLICGVLSICASVAGTLHATRASGQWHTRIPVVGFDSIDTGSKEGKFYQLAFLFLFSVLPLLAMLHFWGIMASASVVTTGANPRELAGIWDWSGLTQLNDPARICSEIQRGSKLTCEKSATFLPFIEPLFIACVNLAAVGLIVRHWVKIFAPCGTVK